MNARPQSLADLWAQVHERRARRERAARVACFGVLALLLPVLFILATGGF